MIRGKQISAVEVTEAYIARINALDDTLGAFITVTADTALEQAKAVDSRIAKGESVGVFAGVPVALKDNICTQDIRTTCGSKMLENFIPPYNAAVVEKILAADMVMPGKCNMDEFAMGSSCENSYYKTTKNPWNTRYVAGGSSGGCAAAVASGMAAVAVGTDTGGSIRMPASYCGVVGLKPTYGAVSRYGVAAYAPSLDTIGPIGRSVGDVAALFELIRGHDARDAVSPNRQYGKIELSGGLDGLTMGIPKELFGDGVTPEAAAMVMDAAKELERNGVTLREVNLPSLEYALPAYYIIASAEASSGLARFDGVRFGHRAPDAKTVDELYTASRARLNEGEKMVVLAGAFFTAGDNYALYLEKAMKLRRLIRDAWFALLEESDAVIMPCETMWTTHASAAALAGLAALTLPTAAGVMQVLVKPGNEQTLADIARRLYIDI
jgi:aspartyl-tRNA(Asn)/glutamyl-tRNA(Gln) amidotransferase subunit A